SSSTNSAEIRPQSAGSDIPWAPSTRYTVTIDGTKLLDANNNAIGGSVVFSFVTGTAAVWAQLSEQLLPASVSPSTVQVLNGSAPLAGLVAYDPATQRVSFTPA